jgi:hypothetical protein
MTAGMTAIINGIVHEAMVMASVNHKDAHKC